MINFFPNFLGCKYKMFTSMREWFSFQVCLQAYFFLSLSLFFLSSHSVILSSHYPPHQKQHGRFVTPLLPECLMESCKASLTFESADEIL